VIGVRWLQTCRSYGARFVWCLVATDMAHLRCWGFAFSIVDLHNNACDRNRLQNLEATDMPHLRCWCDWCSVATDMAHLRCWCDWCSVATDMPLLRSSCVLAFGCYRHVAPTALVLLVFGGYRHAAPTELVSFGVWWLQTCRSYGARVSWRLVATDMSLLRSLLRSSCVLAFGCYRHVAPTELISFGA
jgi:hypothetical protein